MASPALQRAILGDMKMSEFAESVFEDFRSVFGPIAFKKKSEYYSLIQYMSISEIPGEVSEKLDMVCNYLDLNLEKK